MFGTHIWNPYCSQHIVFGMPWPGADPKKVKEMEDDIRSIRERQQQKLDAVAAEAALVCCMVKCCRAPIALLHPARSPLLRPRYRSCDDSERQRDGETADEGTDGRESLRT